MAYIIDRANVLKENGIMKCSILVKQNRIDYIQSNLDRLTYTKMDATNYIMTPGHVMIDYSLCEANKPFTQFKQEMTNQYLSKGCTTLLTVCDVKHERDLSKNLEAAKHRLLNSPIDYYMGIKIPLKIMTPTLIRTCKRKGISLVVVEIEDEDLYQIPWGWIRDALYSYAVPIVPKWIQTEKSTFRRDRHIKEWKEVTEDNNIPTILTIPEDNQPLSLNALRKIGIYPDKGDIRIGGELDYNFYNIEQLGSSVDEMPLLDYHNLNPIITMHKGEFLKVDNRLIYRPGFGNGCKVKLPGYFASSF
ncbi:hypothetical protein IMZ08_19740 [Bacillus luteolus]|uniref:Uncharacterized protein n=1 Tax=Litchfieldia luteola TaxID=682179 RepID=A0ABR9QQ19_9BACI|nr:hypothetical protein [Cytobacillus luteolus]MBE4910274.1 hypothetical protein [Cytobacillus luteolus]MBP1942153.1 hypothetical protein [Cytobacillus luteolus]